jgi:hypothetical protein
MPPRLILFVCLLSCPLGASEPNPWPANAGYKDVRSVFGARGDGITDDTAAFQKAATENVRHLYVPAGTYLLSDTIVFGPKRWVIQGAGEGISILRLIDRAAGFDDPSQPKPFISTFARFMDPQSTMGQAFRTSLFDLTIDIGAGNPGAVGLHYLNNNQGTVRRVTIRTSDSQRAGKAGLAMVTNWPGPALIKDVRVHGFDFGIWNRNAQYSVVFEDLALLDQRVAAFENEGQTVGLHRVRTRGAVPALRISQGTGSVYVGRCDFTASEAVDLAAIQSDGRSAVLVHDTKFTGFPRLMDAPEPLPEPPPGVQALSAPPVAFDPVAPPLPGWLPIEDAPDPPLPRAAEWANVQDFGAMPVVGKDAQDAAPAIQRAIDSGARVVHFPQAVYELRSTVVLRGKVQRLIGCESRMRYFTGSEPAFRIEDGEPDSVSIERFDGDYVGDSKIILDHASKRTLVIRHSMIGRYRNTVPGGKVHLEDVCGGNWEFDGQQVWARQINPEARGQDFNFRLQKTDFWALGVKTEGPKTIFTAADSHLEIHAGFFYANRGTEEGAAAFDLTRSSLVANYVNHLGGNYRPQIRSRSGSSLGEILLHTDFSDRDNLAFLHRVVLDGETLREAIDTRGAPASSRIYRHGSYGVKVPLAIVHSGRQPAR